MQIILTRQDLSKSFHQLPDNQIGIKHVHMHDTNPDSWTGMIAAADVVAFVGKDRSVHVLTSRNSLKLWYPDMAACLADQPNVDNLRISDAAFRVGISGDAP